MIPSANIRQNDWLPIPVLEVDGVHLVQYGRASGRRSNDLFQRIREYGCVTYLVEVTGQDNTGLRMLTCNFIQTV